MVQAVQIRQSSFAATFTQLRYRAGSRVAKHVDERALSPPQVDDADLVTDTGARGSPEAPHPYPRHHGDREISVPVIGATCDDICSSTCTTQGIDSEMDAGYDAATRNVDYLIPAIVEEAAQNLGHY